MQQKVDVIVTYGAAVATLKQATASIPIVFALATDPLGSGLVASLARPGGNVTGLSLQASDIAGKRLELLREAVPRLRQLAIMFDADYSATVREMDEAQAPLARSASKSRHMASGERRILHPLSTRSSPKRTHFTSR